MSATRPIRLSRFSNVEDTDPLHRSGDWEQLRPHLTQHNPVRVELTDEILADPALLKARLDAAKLRGPAISPAIYREGATRGNAGIEAMTCFIADIDDGTSYTQLAERWKTPDGKPLAWALFSTFKSRASAPRYRVVFPLAVDVPKEEWLATWRKFGHWLTDGHIDPSTKDPARLHFLPACPAQWLDEAFVDFSDGKLLDPAMFDDPPAGADDTDEAIAARVRAIRASGNHEATGNGEGRPGDDFNRRATVESVAALLLESGGKEERRNGDAVLLTRPGKHSGVSGVVGFPGDPAPIFYCWSSNWPNFEPGRSYDAFGVFTRVKHNSVFEDAARELGKQNYGTPLASLTQRAERRAATEREKFADLERAVVDFGPTEPDTRPEIIVNARQEREIAADAWGAIRAANERAPILFARGRSLCLLAHDRAGSSYTIDASAPLLAFILRRAANMVTLRTSKEGEEITSPARLPSWLPFDMLADPTAPGFLPYLRAVVGCPVVTSEGELLTTPGYDRRSGLYLDAPAMTPPRGDSSISGKTGSSALSVKATRLTWESEATQEPYQWHGPRAAARPRRPSPRFPRPQGRRHRLSRRHHGRIGALSLL